MSRLVALALVLGVAACRAEPPGRPAEARIPHDSARSIPDGPVAGKIGGAPFAVRDARYRVDRRLGYEKLEVRLSGAPARSTCGPLPDGAPSIWLRRRGAAAAVPGETRLTPGGESDWEVHYQIRGERGWVGSGAAAALLVIRSPQGSALEGDLSVCFADAAGSCASGTFTAEDCPASIDRPVRGTENDEKMPPAAAP